MAKTFTTNPEAYQLYLKGNYHRTKYTEDGVKKAIEYYQKAIEIDPNYALAYSGLAHAYLDANGWYLPPNDVMPKLKAAASKALELDDSLATAHLVLSAYFFLYELDWALTERGIIRAVELEPNNPVSHQVGGYMLLMGRLDDALSEAELSRRLAPFDLQIQVDSASVYHYAGLYDRAIEEANKTVDLDPNYAYSHIILGLAYERKGRLTEAVAELEKAHSLEKSPWVAGYVGYVYAVAGKRAEAQKLLDELHQLSQKRFVSPYSIAMIYAGLDNKDRAFEWLERAFEERCSVPQIEYDSVFINLHSDTRFQDLIKRLNLPE